MEKGIEFPSFAPSLTSSPKILKELADSSTFQSLNSIQKISIHLPQQFLETKNSSSPQKLVQSNLNYEEYERMPQGNNILVYCRMREQVRSLSSMKYDSSMIDTGEGCYSFDHIFGKSASQREVYQRIIHRHLDDFFMGKNSTIFAYGQTGSGKTHTMFGDMLSSQQSGLIPRTLQQIFRRDVKSSSITCSMVEIYNEKLMDLFNPLTSSYTEIKLKQNNQVVFIEGLQQILVQNQQELLNLIKLGHKSRKIAQTRNNDRSSRSHTILFLYRNFVCKNQQYRCKLSFIDLAGSQKIRKSGAKGQTLEEAKKINLSLSCLGNVVHALTNGSEHIPYRDSKLTRILKDSLSTDTNTSIIITCSLEKGDFQESLSTIKFAVRAKKIKNKKKLDGEELTMEQQINQLKKELAETKKQLADYKKKEEDEINSDIPEELVNLLPLKNISINVGISSRLKLTNTYEIE